MDYQELVAQLNQKQLTITCAESLTGGEFQSNLSRQPEAGNVYVGGFITYATASKNKLLGVPKAVIDKAGVVSSLAAKQMAARARTIAETDIGISFTGVAGPNQLEGNPVGTVYIGLSTVSLEQAKQYRFSGDSPQIVQQTCEKGIELLHRLLTTCA
jgi:nicotinamide-nucleotide amidase